MSKTEILNTHWTEFLEWCKFERFLAEDEGFFTAAATNLVTAPSEDNFWKWYMGAKS